MGFSISLVFGVMETIVILGAGIAGLSCLNALLDRQIPALLIDASTIGTPKLCGEFLAPAVIAQLKRWDVGPIQPIKQAHFFAHRNVASIPFANTAGAYPRHEAELALLARALKKGARVIEQNPIQHITPATATAPFILHLTTGEIIEARDVMVATGAFSQQTRPSKQSTYFGFKTHLPAIIEPDTLLMHGFNGGYLGIVPVSGQTSNLTCLLRRDIMASVDSCGDVLRLIMLTDSSLSKHLEGIDLEALHWLKGGAPEFGLKQTPAWPHAYWIGDAFANLHPSIGYGFAHTVTSALMAVEYYLKQDPKAYHHELKAHIRYKRLLGRSLHHILQKPRLCCAISPVLKACPSLSKVVLNQLI